MPLQGFGDGVGAFGGGLSGYTGQPYSSPFATQGRMWTPMHIRFLFESCKFYFLMNPLINAAATKMATYPITEVIVEEQDRALREFYDTYFTETIDLQTHLIEAGLDYNVYGNMLSSIVFPFQKYLVCKSCGFKTPAKQTNFEFMAGRFHKKCKKCGHQGETKVEDIYMKDPNGIRIVRWNPSDFNVYYNEITAERLYQWKIPGLLRHDIMVGKKHVVASTPQEFINAVRDNKPVLFNNERIFHMRRPSISTKTLGRAWGVPMILPVMEDVFYLQVLRKAQEQIATEHLVPLRILFPQGTSAGDQPYAMMNLGDWKDQIQEEMVKFRRDRNYIPVLPVPIGNQTISGDGRALLLHQEIRTISEHIVAGMSVPVEFVFGGLSYSGSSVSMRMLENAMLNYRQEHLRYMRWIVRQISEYMGWPSTKLGLRDFRMADDLNRRQYLFNLWQAGLLCDQDLLDESGFDAAEQKEKRQTEEKAKFSEQERMLLAQTESQNKATRVQQMAGLELQMEMQQKQMEMMPPQPQMMPGMEQGGQMMPQEGQMPEGEAAPGDQVAQAGSDLSAQQGAAGAQPTDQGGAQINLLQVAQQIAMRLLALDPNARATELARIRMQQPALAAEVVRIIKEQGKAGPALQSLPEQRPPRRGPESALV